MAPEFDDTEFIDRDYQAARKAGGSAGVVARPPTREELEARVGETHQKLAELKRAQEALERERTALEEARRRRAELQHGQSEMVHHLTRGIGLLEESELKTRQELEQMGRTLAGFRDAMAKVQSIHEESWKEDNWQAELSRALTILENARMEWNAARLRWPVLEGLAAVSKEPTVGGDPAPAASLAGLGFFQLARIGLALTWPLTLLAVVAFVVWLIYLFGK